VYREYNIGSKGIVYREYTIESQKQAIMLGISPNNLDVFLKYLDDIHNHIRRQVIHFKIRDVDEAIMEARYLVMYKKRGQPSRSK
jgi:hypothetical protein